MLSKAQVVTLLREELKALADVLDGDNPNAVSLIVHYECSDTLCAVLDIEAQAILEALQSAILVIAEVSNRKAPQNPEPLSAAADRVMYATALQQAKSEVQALLDFQVEPVV